MPETKECTKCHRDLPKTEEFFYVSPTGVMNYWCRQCVRETAQARNDARRKEQGIEGEVRRVAQRSAERALRDERTALSAIVKVFLTECPNPERVLTKIEGMTRAAEANPRTSAVVKRTLLDGTQFVKTAVERELGKPQTLWDPHVGHVDGTKVDALIQGGDQVQLGLDAPSEAHEERMQSRAEVGAVIIESLKTHGRATDSELHALYSKRVISRAVVNVSHSMFIDCRRQLVQAGRLRVVDRIRGEPVWDLVEQGMGT